MSQKKKTNFPLINVLVASMLVHLVAGVILGGYILTTMVIEAEPEFIPPPEIKRVQPERLEYKVKMKQQQKQSAKPRMKRIQVESPTNITVPQIDIVAPTVSSDVAVGTGLGGGSGSGNGLGAGGGIGLGKVSVDFFGVKNSGEKVFLIVDASKYILEDQKGGIPAYNIVKQEVKEIINKLPRGTLFNMAFYSNGSISLFNKKMVAVTPELATKIGHWIDPINQSYASAGNVNNNHKLRYTQVAPMNNDVWHWARAVQLGMEQQADAIFLLVSQWQWHGKHYGLAMEKGWDERERVVKEWLKTEGWDDKRMAQYYEDEKTAQDWLNNENEKRSAAGEPQKVVHNIREVMKEIGLEIPPDPHWGAGDIAKHFKEVIKLSYKKNKLPAPALNIVLFKGEDEEMKEQEKMFKQIARVSSKGRFKVLRGMKGLQNVTGAKGKMKLAMTLN